MDNHIRAYVDLLKKNSYSDTSARRAVFLALYSYGLQTIEQLIKRCSGVNRASIYRSIDLFVKLGVAIRVPQGFKYKIELSEMFLPHHHHIICKECSLQADIEQSKLEQLLVDIAEFEGYKLSTHKVELIGICSNCLNKC